MSMLISTTLAEALDMLAADPSSMVLAGGTDAMVEVNSGHRRPEAVIAVGRIPELRTWSHDAHTSTLRIGAAVTYAELEQEPFLQWVPRSARLPARSGRHRSVMPRRWAATWRPVRPRATACPFSRHSMRSFTSSRPPARARCRSPIS